MENFIMRNYEAKSKFVCFGWKTQGWKNLQSKIEKEIFECLVPCWHYFCNGVFTNNHHQQQQPDNNIKPYNVTKNSMLGIEIVTRSLFPKNTKQIKIKQNTNNQTIKKKNWKWKLGDHLP